MKTVFLILAVALVALSAQAHPENGPKTFQLKISGYFNSTANTTVGFDSEMVSNNQVSGGITVGIEEREVKNACLGYCYAVQNPDGFYLNAVEVTRSKALWLQSQIRTATRECPLTITFRYSDLNTAKIVNAVPCPNENQPSSY